MTRYLLALATVAGALALGAPAASANACDDLPPGVECGTVLPVFGCHKIGNLPGFCIDKP